VLGWKDIVAIHPAGDQREVGAGLITADRAGGHGPHDDAPDARAQPRLLVGSAATQRPRTQPAPHRDLLRLPIVAPLGQEISCAEIEIEATAMAEPGRFPAQRGCSAY
jgi:hypothetical protein